MQGDIHLYQSSRNRKTSYQKEKEISLPKFKMREKEISLPKFKTREKETFLSEGSQKYFYQLLECFRIHTELSFLYQNSFERFMIA